MRQQLPDENTARREGQFIEGPKFENTDFRKCALCAHNPTCDILKMNARFIAQNYDVEKHSKENPTIPFEYNDLAKVCNFFQYKTGTKTEELLRK